jgi:hypothetical protein
MRAAAAGSPMRKAQRRSFATAELPMDKVEAMVKTRMHPRHSELNELLDGKAAEGGDTRATSTAVISAPRVPEGYSRE